MVPHVLCLREHRIAGWVVPSKKADDSVAEQCLRGFSREWSRVQVGDTGYGDLYRRVT